MLTIRLTRVGKKKYPTYRFIISEKSRDPWGKSLEVLGNYNPHTKDIVLKKERIAYWLSQGAGTSETVHNLLIKSGVLKKEEKKKPVKITKKRAAKLAEAKKEKEEKIANKKAIKEEEEVNNEPQKKEEVEGAKEEKTEEKAENAAEGHDANEEEK